MGQQRKRVRGDDGAVRPTPPGTTGGGNRFSRHAPLVAMAILAIQLLAVEAVALLILRARGERLPYLIYAGSWRTSASTDGAATSYATLDPILGFSGDWVKLEERSAARGVRLEEGFAWYREATAAGGGPIVALGGSTTDDLHALARASEPGASAHESWPHQLQRLLAGAGAETGVVNGGVAGYSSSQELLKLVRDVVPLRPSVVLSLEGVNEVGGFYSVEHHPMVHPYQRQTFETVLRVKSSTFLPNTWRVIEKLLRRVGQRVDFLPATWISYGTANDRAPWEQWETNIRMMRAIGGEMGFEYLVLLQPAQGFGSYTPDERERAMLERKGETYAGALVEFYSHAVEICGRLDYCVDLTDLFAGESGLYDDPRHPGHEGYGRIALAAFRVLEARGLLDPQGGEEGRPATISRAGPS